MPAQIRQYTLKEKGTGMVFYRCQLVGTEIFGEGKTKEEAFENLKVNVKKVKAAFLLTSPKKGDKPIKIPKGQLTVCDCKKLSSTKMCPHGNFKIPKAVQKGQEKYRAGRKNVSKL